MESHTRFLTSLSVTQCSNPKYCTCAGSPEQLKIKNSSLEDEVFKSNIQAYLNEKALGFKKLEKAWREEVYNSTVHDEANSSLGFSESQKSKWKEELDQELMRMREFNPKYYKVAGGPEQLKTKISSLEDEVFKSNIEACLNEKALEFKKVEKALREEVYNNTGHDEASSSLAFSERQRLKWKEALDQELMRMREMRRQAGVRKNSIKKSTYVKNQV